MVTINKTLTYLVIGLFMVMAMAVSVSASKLTISDIDVKVGSKTSKNLEDGETVDDEAVPGDEIEVKVEFYNNYTDAEDLDIEDIEVTITIEGIDDEDDLEEEINEFDISADDEKRVTASFTVPEQVGEGSFDITIDAEGEDENGTTHSVTATVQLDVEKESHELRWTRAVLSPEQVSCGKTVQASVEFINTGQEDEEGIFTLENSELGVSFSDEYEVVEGEFDEDMEFGKTYTFTVGKDVEAGIYPLAIKATYNDERRSITDTLDLTVNECEPATDASDEETDDVVVTQPKPADTTTVVISQPTGAVTPIPGQTTTAQIVEPSPAVMQSEESSIFDNSAFLVGVVVIEVLIVIVGIAIVAYLMRR